MPHPYTIVGLGEILWDMLPGGKQLGGAPANFAYHANALGATGAVVSRVGDDEPGREILRRLDELGLNRRYVGVDPDHPTGRVNVRLDARGVPDYVIHQDVAWDFLANPGDDPALAGLARRCDAVCFGSLAQRGAVSRRSIAAFLDATGPRCLRVFDVNLRQSYYDRDTIDASLRRSGVLKLNETELPDLGKLLGVAGEGPAAVEELFRRYPMLSLVALTAGDRGSALYAAAGETSRHGGFPTEVADTVGAGDAFTAALVLGLLDDHDLGRINAFANRLASYVCSQPGATPPIPAAVRGQRA